MHKEVWAKQLAQEYLINYKKEHMTKSGVGNKQALRAFEVGEFNPKEFVHDVLDEDFVVKFLAGPSF